jgi:hypothetical protein
VTVEIAKKYKALLLDRDPQSGMLSNTRIIYVDGENISGLPKKTWELISSPQIMNGGLTSLTIGMKYGSTTQALFIFSMDPNTARVTQTNQLLTDGDTNVPGMTGKKIKIVGDPKPYSDKEIILLCRVDEILQVLFIEIDYINGKIVGAVPFLSHIDVIPGITGKKWNIDGTPSFSPDRRRMIATISDPIIDNENPDKNEAWVFQVLFDFDPHHRTVSNPRIFPEDELIPGYMNEVFRTPIFSSPDGSQLMLVNHAKENPGVMVVTAPNKTSISQTSTLFWFWKALTGETDVAKLVLKYGPLESVILAMVVGMIVPAMFIGGFTIPTVFLISILLGSVWGFAHLFNHHSAIVRHPRMSLAGIELDSRQKHSYRNGQYVPTIVLFRNGTGMTTWASASYKAIVGSLWLSAFTGLLILLWTLAGHDQLLLTSLFHAIATVGVAQLAKVIHFKSNRKILLGDRHIGVLGAINLSYRNQGKGRGLERHTVGLDPGHRHSGMTNFPPIAPLGLADLGSAPFELKASKLKPGKKYQNAITTIEVHENNLGEAQSLLRQLENKEVDVHVLFLAMTDNVEATLSSMISTSQAPVAVLSRKESTNPEGAVDFPKALETALATRNSFRNLAQSFSEATHLRLLASTNNWQSTKTSIHGINISRFDIRLYYAGMIMDLIAARGETKNLNEVFKNLLETVRAIQQAA